MVLCPDGHGSARDDVCDVCGRRLGGHPAAGQASTVGKHRAARPGRPPATPPAAPNGPDTSDLLLSLFSATWIVRIASDRRYYDQMTVVRGDRSGLSIAFPDQMGERRIPLTGKQMRIGRRSAARDLEPEIDLAGPPADPGISRLHAMLIAGPDGTWGVLDPGSANGTQLNGHEIAVGDLIPLRDGDRINLGAWTAITVHRG
ncbi:MAG: FHA domain-containing protein [Actinobacteria bacterium]|nr:FHA domain-containing protein [Actinomycetota bacterium]